ncbi:MAG TPA: adenylate/guanylate cyclase domain-containing protein [Aeromicrobium sp.]|nr:adenylate/guanylate cyclase domain-containing protein [Aeromicrobium sp.]
MNATPALDDFAQRARWRSFLDPALEAEYRLWHRDQILPVARLVGLVSLVLWLLIPLWFRVFFGDVPSVIFLSAFVVAVPTFSVLLVLSYTALNRWTNLAVAIANVVIGLTFIWVMTVLYGRLSGPVACVVFVTVFYPLIVRMRTGAATFVAVLLTSIPTVFHVVGIRSGDISFADSWPYIALLVTNLPIVIGAAGQIETGMRRQFAAQLTVARQQRELEASQRLIRRYAPAAVAARIESGDAAAVGVPKRVRVTALSSDVAGFTVLADRLDPEALSEIINEYVGAMSGIVEGEGGVITEFAGDGLMAIFGAPEEIEPVDQVRRAVAVASEMHRRLAELNGAWGALGVDQPLRVRIGINTGVLSVGSFGSDGRATYTAIGLQMNVAARIQAQCQPGSTLLSSSSWHLVKDELPCDPLGEVSVKGVHYPISIYAPRADSAAAAT